MKLVPKEFEEFNEVTLLCGGFLTLAGGYGSALLLVRGPFIVALPLRAVFLAATAAGVVLLVAQLRSWRRGRLERQWAMDAAERKRFFHMVGSLAVAVLLSVAAEALRQGWLNWPIFICWAVYFGRLYVQPMRRR